MKQPKKGSNLLALAAASNLITEPMSGADAVRAMTGGNAGLRISSAKSPDVREAYQRLQVAITDLQDAKDLIERRLAEYCGKLDQEIERLQP